MIQIRIIGDSSSSSIGLDKAGYPHFLFTSAELLEHTDFHIVNFSVPGLTSSDAAQLCATPAFKGSFHCLIIYLGNNEGISATPKGSPDRWRRLKYKLKRPAEKPLRPPRYRTHRFVFRELLQVVVPNRPDQFGWNLQYMIRAARKVRAPVILINPAVNHSFPSGVFATNGLFFKYIGLKEATGSGLQGLDNMSEQLVKAIQLQELGQSAEAKAVYEQLVSSGSGSPLPAYIARHNLAIGFQEPATAIRSLLQLKEQVADYESIICYNLSQLYRLLGDRSRARSYLDESCEKDSSTPRTKKAYREVIARLAKKSDVYLIDLATLLGPYPFIDYCHPTTEGHQKITQALVQLLCQILPKGRSTGSHSYENRYISPDMFYEEGDLVDYYQIDRDLAEDSILQEMRKIICRPIDGKPDPPNMIAKYLINFLNTNNQHAAFNTALDLLGPQVPYSHEILSFPEFYIYRLLYNYCAVFEEQQLASRLEAEEACSSLVLRSYEYKGLILRHNSRPLTMELNLSPVYLNNLEFRIPRMLEGPAFRNAIGERIKTMGVWYTREAFRYGTHSRISMLYDRWNIEQAGEALAVASVIADHHSMKDRLQRYGRLFRELLELEQLHRQQVTLYLKDPYAFSGEVYEEGLQCIRQRISGILTAA